ncbi:MAG: ATP-dependent sacrificial sulfur transferase LarE [Treponema sp.]|nr:ATP-dependent sacrificial sulfur transferase LarE [Treponema sp.]
MTDITQKYKRLLDYIAAKESAAVAFSGGVDSSFLCYAASQALGTKAVAITIVSPMLPKSEIADARKTAEQLGITHVLVEEDGIDGEVAANPHDRCYHCKKIEFSRILAEAKKRGIQTVFDGSNIDDLGDYRPGLKALEELHIASPLREAGLHKNEIRILSKTYNLPTWNKPAFACLASRIPYGEHINREKLSRVEKAEDYLRSLGFIQFRVRSHQNMARIEAAPEERRKFFDEKVLDAVSRTLKSFGFIYVAFELEGYVTGSMNREVSVIENPAL